VEIELFRIFTELMSLNFFEL